MNPVAPKRCAVHARVSSDERLDQSFNSIDAQREAGVAYIASQRAEGWIVAGDDYLDPGYSGGNMDRPGLKRLLSPTVVKGLLAGRQPRTLSLIWLKNHEVPASWDDQAALFGRMDR